MPDPLQLLEIRQGGRLISYAIATIAFIATMGGVALYLILT